MKEYRRRDGSRTGPSAPPAVRLPSDREKRPQLPRIAVSYNLFSHRNSDADLDKDVTWKSDLPQTYVSKILQVSSMFEDDADGGSGEESKVETWSSQWLLSPMAGAMPSIPVATKPFFCPCEA
ncbi:hypothetical protein AXF42_Ash020593 [Apostasia shenzhenica]|uniref:Uncharacterized protein n=1 Tax=Apostasia shenzhenica TaxID=1088818 RepID=A0A2I0A0G3_9ASPA|nr:hypothetical protein AXF42_Ash020593 [Apostasia shenzhenica]